MHKADSLIHTKLHLPFTRPELVPRPRLQEQIARGLRGPLTLITAPAGFGKTTLVASSIQNCGIPVAWLSLDKDDNQPGRFLTYLIGAIHHSDERVGIEASPLMAGLQQVSHEAVLTSLINELVNIQTEMALVLDDYQVISNPTAHDDVAFLLDHQPGTFHLIIATRSDPPLPLARLRARGQTVELRAVDLRFTEVEASLFLKDVMGLPLDESSIALLEGRTEGWIAGLQMAALSMRDRKDLPRFIEGFSGTNRYILDYLLEEVLACQPPEIQRFLLYTSILERFNAPLCDTVLDHDGEMHPEAPSRVSSASVLEMLDRENLFLVSLDDERIWFRYHHLFADLLRSRLHQTQPDLIARLHLLASTWLEQNELIPEAIQHLFATHEDRLAAGLIEQYGPSYWVDSDLSVVQMADNLPREILIERPKIGLYLSWYHINHGKIEKAYPLLCDLAHHLAGTRPDSDQHWILTVVRLALAFLTPPDASGIDPLPDNLEMDEIPADDMVMRDVASILYGMALARRGENDHAAEFALKTMQNEKIFSGTQSNTIGAPTIPTLVPFLAAIYMFQGKLHAAATLCQEYLEPIKEKGIRISTAGNLDVVLGEVLYEWNYLEEAEETIREGLRANEPWGNIMTDAFGMLALTVVLQAKADYAGAMQIVGKFEKRLQDQSRPIEFAEPFRTLRVRVQLASGDIQGAALWADQIIQSDDFVHNKEYYRLTLARIRLAQGRHADAEEILTGIPHSEKHGNRIASRIESNLLMAAALAGQQRLPEAFALIEASIALAEPDFYIRVFLDGGETIRDLLSAYTRSDTHLHNEFCQRLLASFSPKSGVNPPSNQPAGMAEPLSARELEVLQLMALGRTNLEIAGQLIVARGTVKAHAASIFRKLAAANRTEAVARARLMGLLS